MAEPRRAAPARCVRSRGATPPAPGADPRRRGHRLTRPGHRLLARAALAVSLAALGGCAGTYQSVCGSGADAVGLLVVTGACGALYAAEEATKRADQAAARSAGAEHARATRRAWLLRDASNGNHEAAYRLSLLMAFEGDPDATRWACSAASGGHRPARVLLASWYNPALFETLVSPERINPDLRYAYAWYTLATDRDDANAELFRTRLGSGLTDVERAQADRMVEGWRPGLCPEPEQR